MGAQTRKSAQSAMFIARLDALRRITAFVEAYCAAAAIPRSSALRLNLVLEELFVNTVRHGHRGDCDQPVWITLQQDGATVEVTYEDTGPPFNPYAHVERSAAREGGKIGGLGVLLTQELAANRDYAYIFGRNRIRLGLAL
ncbi:MAG TPA: ATP-binding protein [Burkholderiales bacterium]|nr:ATP-binding protein [Burkholderiales bacterium]